MMKRMLCVLVVFVAFIAAAPAQTANFPEKEVQIIIPWAPGGATDLVFRALAASTAKYLGQAVVIVNKAGGGGAVSVDVSATRRARPSAAIAVHVVDRAGSAANASRYPIILFGPTRTPLPGTSKPT